MCVHSHLHEVGTIPVLSGEAAVVHDVLVSTEVFPTIAGVVTVLPGAVHEGLLTELHQQIVLQDVKEGEGRGGEGRGEEGRGGKRRGEEGVHGEVGRQERAIRKEH